MTLEENTCAYKREQRCVIVNFFANGLYRVKLLACMPLVQIVLAHYHKVNKK